MLWRIAVWVILAIVSTLALAPVAAAAAGYRVFFSGPSGMGDSIRNGDLIVDRRVPASTIRRGDVVTMKLDGGTAVTHRVTGVMPDRPGYLLITKGDANRVPEAWTISGSATVLRTTFRVRALGWLFRLVPGPAAAVLAVACGVALSFGRRLRMPVSRSSEPQPVPAT